MLYNLGKLNDQQKAMHFTRKLFSKDFDLALNDLQKNKQCGLHVYTDEDQIALDPTLNIFSNNYTGEKTHEMICEAL